MITRRRALVALAIVAAGAAAALARPGGGDSYSGGGGHGGGGDSGGIGLVLELLFHLIRLAFYYPTIGIPLILIVIGGLIWAWRIREKNRDWDSGPKAKLDRAIDLDAVRRVDPDFSQVLFEDFAFRLFGTAHRARAAETTLDQLAPYVAPPARRALSQREPIGAPVASVVIGAMRVFRTDVPEAPVDDRGRAARVRVGLEFEANVTAGDHTYFSVETWLFGREATAKTKPPDPARRFACPNCGAPWQAAATGTQVCSYCDQVVDNGRFDWVVEQVVLESLDERPPSLTASVQERGTDLETYMQPDFDTRWLSLVQDDPALDDASVLARVALIYAALMRDWARNDLGPSRGLISDGLYDYLTYWITAYVQQGLRNELVDMRITHTAMCKLVRDRWYDALTIRIFATGKDFVVRVDDGSLVKGSRHREREYSEYWTLVRSAARRGPARTDESCPNCGAPRVVNMAGACDHCGAHLTAGEFDWVLSKIEQDDSYRG